MSSPQQIGGMFQYSLDVRAAALQLEPYPSSDFVNDSPNGSDDDSCHSEGVPDQLDVETYQDNKHVDETTDPVATNDDFEGAEAVTARDEQVSCYDELLKTTLTPLSHKHAEIASASSKAVEKQLSAHEVEGSDEAEATTIPSLVEDSTQIVNAANKTSTVRSPHFSKAEVTTTEESPQSVEATNQTSSVRLLGSPYYTKAEEAIVPSLTQSSLDTAGATHKTSNPRLLGSPYYSNMDQTASSSVLHSPTSDFSQSGQKNLETPNEFTVNDTVQSLFLQYQQKLQSKQLTSEFPDFAELQKHSTPALVPVTNATAISVSNLEELNSSINDSFNCLQSSPNKDADVDFIRNQFHRYTEEINNRLVESKLSSKQVHQEEMNRVKASHASELATLQSKVEQLKEQLAQTQELLADQHTKHEVHLEEVEEREAQLEQKLLMFKAFHKWSASAAEKKHEEQLMQISAAQQKQQVQRAALNQWQQNAREAACQRAQELQDEVVRAAVTEVSQVYEARIAELSAELAKEKKRSQDEAGQQDAEKEKLRQAFMRSVCALNREAMTVFEGSEASSAQPLPTFSPVPAPISTSPAPDAPLSALPALPAGEQLLRDAPNSDCTPVPPSPFTAHFNALQQHLQQPPQEVYQQVRQPQESASPAPQQRTLSHLYNASPKTIAPAPPIDTSSEYLRISMRHSTANNESNKPTALQPTKISGNINFVKASTSAISFPVSSSENDSNALNFKRPVRQHGDAMVKPRVVKTVKPVKTASSKSEGKLARPSTSSRRKPSASVASASISHSAAARLPIQSHTAGGLASSSSSLAASRNGKVLGTRVVRHTTNRFK
mmetsp:Transcript_46739/g.91963  ORF Transcript_46739/g.91963 Transcript_46739/m.91963 type:complete len:836 (+) Transcript_46739:600-3107(+)